jgi:hypothetical protein
VLPSEGVGFLKRYSNSVHGVFTVRESRARVWVLKVVSQTTTKGDALRNPVFFALCILHFLCVFATRHALSVKQGGVSFHVRFAMINRMIVHAPFRAPLRTLLRSLDITILRSNDSKRRILSSCEAQTQVANFPVERTSYGN